MAEFQATEQLLHLLPDTTALPGSSSSGDTPRGGGMLIPVGGEAAAAAAAAFRAEVAQLQAQDAAVSGQLSAAVDEVEGMLAQLQALYAALAHATLTAAATEQQQQQGPPQGPP
jgi:hypothetical protein